MKTLKKTLCLVLAVVMVVGVLVLPANAAATTAVDADAEAAFNTLFGYGVMNGADGNHTPDLNRNINRQDMAAIVYRIMAGDTADKYKDNYKSAANEFADSATFADWAKGYIGYVRNQGIFVGDNNGNFKPKEEIKGNDVLTVLLRCLGYGQNGEFTGANYAQNALTQATQLHMFGDSGNWDGIDFLSVKADMSKAINRGTVAKLTYNASINYLATYFNGTYTTYRANGRPVAPNTPGAVRNPQLLAHVSTPKFSGYTKFGIGVKKYGQTVTFNAPDIAVTYDLPDVVIYDQPVKEYWTPVTHCQVAQDLGFSSSLTFTVYTNGAANKTTTTLYATNTQAQIGAQGRHTLIFDAIQDDYNTPDTIVYIDTLLAEVRDVTPASFDAAGHLKTAARLDLRVYDGSTSGYSDVYKLNGATNYSYTKGQYLLVNAVHTEADSALAAAKDIITYDGGGYLDVNKNMCYDVEGKDVKSVGDGYLVDIVGVATSISGAQSKVWYNVDVDKHTVAGTDYNDNNRFHKDEAGNDIYNSYTWFFDTKGNLIGDVKNATAHAYGVITSMWWTDGTEGVGYAQAKVTYIDGTTDTLLVGTVTVYTGDGTAAMKDATTATTAKGAATQGDATEAMTYVSGKLYVNESAATNDTKDDLSDANHHGIIFDNLFQITTDSNGVSDFIEVAGKDNSEDAYKGMSNPTTMVRKGVVDNYVTAISPSSVASTKGDHLKITDSTQFLIGKSTSTGYAFTTVTGYKNIVDYKNGEVDFVDANSDGYADYVYITAAPTTESGWHIFYADALVVSDASGSKAQMKYVDNGSTTTVYGWLDGVEGSVTISNGTSMTTIRNAFVNEANGHTLWLVKIEDGKVTEVDGARSDNKAVNDKTNNGYTAYQGGVALNNNANGMESTNILTGTYKDLSIIVLSGDKDNKKVSEGLYNIGGKDYTIDDKTVMIDGNMDDIKNEKATLIIVFDGRTDKNNLIAQMYVINDDAGTGYVTPDTTYTVTLATSNSLRIKLPATVTAKTDGKTDVTFTITGPMATATEALSATVTGGTATVAIDWTSAGATVGDYTYKVTVSDVTGNVTVTLNIVDPTATISAVPAGTTVVLPESSSAVTLPTDTGEGTIDANGNDINVTDATTISGTVKNVGKVSSEAAITVSGTLEAETIAEGAKVTVEAGGKLDADKIEAGAEITVTGSADSEPGAAMDVQSTNPDNVQELVKLDSASSAKVDSIIGAVVKLDEDSTATYGEDDEIKVKAGYVFSFKTGDSKGSANITVQITNAAGEVVIDGGTVPAKYAAMDVVFYQFHDFTSGGHTPSSDDVLTITVKDGTTVIAAAKFTYTA